VGLVLGNGNHPVKRKVNDGKSIDIALAKSHDSLLARAYKSLW
jgi:hypothetical protein